MVALKDLWKGNCKDKFLNLERLSLAAVGVGCQSTGNKKQGGLDGQVQQPVFRQYVWMFPKIRGKLPKWMVKTMENPIKMDDLGVPLFLETPVYQLCTNHLLKKHGTCFKYWEVDKQTNKCSKVSNSVGSVYAMFTYKWLILM